MVLTTERIEEISRAHLRVVGAGYVRPSDATGFARAIESEVRKDDEALIRQMREAINALHGWFGSGEWYGPKTPHWHDLTSAAITAANARLEKAP